MKVLLWVFFFSFVFSLSLLPSVAQERDNSHGRNYQNCLYGLGCDQSQLSSEEQQAVARAAHGRNYQNCLYGLYGCSQSQLTSEEQLAVTRAAHNRNYQNCLYGLYGCNSGQLSTDEREHVASSTISRTATENATDAAPSLTAPVCAENGSCYGDISERTGR